MRIMVTEDVPGAGAAIARELTGAGHEVVRCHEGGHGGLCIGLATQQTCPLDAGALDVAIAVREAEPDLTAQEHGLLCALRRRVPVAVVTEAPVTPLGPLAVRIASANVAEACAAVANGRQSGHETAIRRSLWAMPQLALVPGEHVTARVHRAGRRLLVDVQVPSEAAASFHSAIADRAARAVRVYDPDAAQIDITVTGALPSQSELQQLLG